MQREVKSSILVEELVSCSNDRCVSASGAAIENILKPYTLTLFLYFVVPGFVAIKVFDLLIPTERRDFGAALIEVVSYSLVNWVLFAWLLAEHNATNPAVTAWDAFFSRRDASYIVFHLKSKELVGALFDTQSFATAWPGPQEVYVEQLWVIDPTTRRFIKPVVNTNSPRHDWRERLCPAQLCRWAATRRSGACTIPTRNGSKQPTAATATSVAAE